MLVRGSIRAARRPFSAEAVSVFNELSDSVPTLAPGALGPSPAAEVTTLANGVSGFCGYGAASMLEPLSRRLAYETAATRGASRVLKHSGFKSPE